MDLFRKFLIRLRKAYYRDGKKFFTVGGGVVAALVLLTLLADWLLPFATWGTVLRSALLVPTAAAIFSVGYGVSLRLHDSQVASDPTWAPYRSRFSPTRRLQIAAVVAAVLFVFAYASTRGVGYTLVSSLLTAVGLALLAFVRTTHEEAKRQKLGVPDARDLAYSVRQQAYEEKLAAKKAAKAEARGKKPRTPSVKS